MVFPVGKTMLALLLDWRGSFAVFEFAIVVARASFQRDEDTEMVSVRGEMEGESQGRFGHIGKGGACGELTVD